MSRPTLYLGTKNASSWALRAWLAMKAADLSFDEVVVDIRKPQRFGNLAQIGAFSPPACVPVLVTENAVIFDSNAIMEFANDQASGALLPADLVARAEARALIAWQHSGLSAICKRISFESSFYEVRRQLTGTEQRECDRLFAHYEYLLKRYGGPYLFGGISLADFMHAPTVIRLSSHEADLSQFPATAAWFETLQSYSPLSQWMDEARRLPPIWFDDYLEPDSDVGILRLKFARQ